MPNYSYVVDASYSPLTLQEMLVPFSVYKEDTDKDIEASIELAKNANVFEYLSKTLPKDSKSRQIYEKYANDLRAQSDDFNMHGRTMMNANELLNLRRRYSGEIGRLERADKVLQEERTRRLNEKDTSMIYGTNNLTIDDFLDENTPNLYKISGNELMSLGEAMGKQISSRRYSQGDAGSIMGGQYSLFKETQGISPEQLDYFMQTEGNKLADQILYERGVTDNLSGYEYNRAKQSVLNGIYAGIVYNESTKPMENKAVTSAIQLQREKELARYKNTLDKSGAEVTEKSLALRPRYILSPKEEVLQKEGKLYDSTNRTEFEFPFSDTAMQKRAKQYILTALWGKPLKEIEMDDKTNTFKETGKELKVEDLVKDDYTVVSDTFGEFGSSVFIQDKNGNITRYKTPSGINATMESARLEALTKAMSWQKVAAEMENKLKNADVDNLTKKDFENKETYDYAKEEYKKFIQMAELYHSQLYVTNETDKQTFKPFGE